MSAELILPNGQVRPLGTLAEPESAARELAELNELDAADAVAEAERAAAARLLVESGGLPSIRITLDPETLGAKITAVGVDTVLMPAILRDLAGHVEASL